MELNSQLHSVPLNILNESIRVDLKMKKNGTTN